MVVLMPLPGQRGGRLPHFLPGVVIGWPILRLYGKPSTPITFLAALFVALALLRRSSPAKSWSRVWLMPWELTRLRCGDVIYTAKAVSNRLNVPCQLASVPWQSLNVVWRRPIHAGKRG